MAIPLLITFQWFLCLQSKAFKILHDLSLLHLCIFVSLHPHQALFLIRGIWNVQNQPCWPEGFLHIVLSQLGVPGPFSPFLVTPSPQGAQLRYVLSRKPQCSTQIICVDMSVFSTSLCIPYSSLDAQCSVQCWGWSRYVVCVCWMSRAVYKIFTG